MWSGCRRMVGDYTFSQSELRRISAETAISSRTSREISNMCCDGELSRSICLPPRCLEVRLTVFDVRVREGLGRCRRWIWKRIHRRGNVHLHCRQQCSRCMSLDTPPTRVPEMHIWTCTLKMIPFSVREAAAGNLSVACRWPNWHDTKKLCIDQGFWATKDKRAWKKVMHS